MAEYGKPIYGNVTEANPIVELESGKVRGIGRNGIAVFKGIPYGAPVDGEGRFLPPKKVEPWEGIKDCIGKAPTAWQFGTAGGVQEDYFSAGKPELFDVVSPKGLSQEEQEAVDCGRTENCLIANVLTPGLDDQKRPVLCYIHGGGFSTGCGIITYGCDNLVKEQDLVVVSLHHRLNVFGYMYLGAFDEKYKSSGMAGMVDLVLGLEWVRDNIAKFGGDPEKVTIIGESGGAMKICHLLNMESAKDLFRYAILESGSGKVGADNRAEATEAARVVLKNLGISENELDKLKDFTAEEILKASESVHRVFRPVPDDIYLRIQDEPKFAYEEFAKTKPILVGCSEDELAMFVTADQYVEITEENLLPELKKALCSPRFGGANKDMTDEQVQAIIDGFKEIAHQEDPTQLYWHISSFASFLGSGAYHHAQERAGQGGAPVYGYYHTVDVPSIPIAGHSFSWHVADLALQFRHVYYDWLEQLSEFESAHWAQFVRTGDPSLPDMQWPVYTLAQPDIVRLDLKQEIVHDYRIELDELLK